MSTPFDPILDEYSTEVGNFLKKLDSDLYTTLYPASDRTDLVPDETSSGSEIDLEALRANIEIALDTTSESTSFPLYSEESRQLALEYLKAKIRAKYDQYLNDEITLAEFIASNSSKDYNLVFAYYSIGVFNLYRHGLSPGMVFLVLNKNKVRSVYIKTVTDNTFTVSYHKNGIQAQDFIEDTTYTFFLANWAALADEITEYIKNLTLLADKFNQMLKDILNFKYPTDFMGLNISTIPIGTLIKLGTAYKPRTFTDREMLDVIKYFALIIKKMVNAFNKLLEAQPKDPLIANSIDALNNLSTILDVVVKLVNISATVADIVAICRRLAPKAEILANIIGAWMNPALLSKLIPIFIQEGQKIVSQIIADVEKEITEYLFKLPVPVPTLILDFFLDPKPIPPAGDTALVADINNIASNFGRKVDEVKQSSDQAIKSVVDYKLKEAPPRAQSNQKDPGMNQSSKINRKANDL
jgi:hypothetical protein